MQSPTSRTSACMRASPRGLSWRCETQSSRSARAQTSRLNLCVVVRCVYMCVCVCLCVYVRVQMCGAARAADRRVGGVSRPAGPRLPPLPAHAMPRPPQGEPPHPPPSPPALPPNPLSTYPSPLPLLLPRDRGPILLSSRSWCHMCVFNPRFGTLPKTKPIASSPPQPIASSSLTPSHS